MAAVPLSSKSQLRRALRRQRAAVGARRRATAARRALARLSRSQRWRRSRGLALYFSHGSEFPTQALVQLAWRSGKQVFLPRLRGEHMRLIRARPGKKLRPNRFGIPEPWPPRGQALLRDIDLMLMPLTGFDRGGGRLGTGGGYYDRLLARHGCSSRPFRLGWALALQEVPEVPCDAWDVRLHAVCTEHEWIVCRPRTAPAAPSDER